MGTVLFAILCLIGIVDSPVDLIILCALISIDTIGLTQVWKVIRKAQV